MLVCFTGNVAFHVSINIYREYIFILVFIQLVASNTVYEGQLFSFLFFLKAVKTTSVFCVGRSELVTCSILEMSQGRAPL